MEEGASHFPHGHFLMANKVTNDEVIAIKNEQKCKFKLIQVRSDLSVGADEGGLQEVAAAPGVLALPHQVSGGVVGSIARCSPDLRRPKRSEIMNLTNNC